MILVTGGTGNIGRHLVGRLVDAGERVRLMVRDPGVDGLPAGVEVVCGDMNDAATLGEAFAGADRAFLLAPGQDVPAQEAALIGAAVRAAVGRVVLVSSLGVEMGGIGSGAFHMSGEGLLRESALPWTILHPSEFMTNTLWWAETVRSAGSIFVPTGDGRVGFIDPADIAAAAMAVLTADGHVGMTYRLTGPEALSTAAVAERISAATGRTVRHVDVPETAFREGMEGAGLPEGLIEMQVRYCAAIKEGRVDMVTQDVEKLTGRPSVDYAAWLAPRAAAFLP